MGRVLLAANEDPVAASSCWRDKEEEIFFNVPYLRTGQNADRTLKFKAANMVDIYIL